MKDTTVLGLRDRKRQATRERLERAAVQIVAEAGLDALTIDAISERAEVSPRTFFNYFDSKEDAILGIRLGEDLSTQIEQTLCDIRPSSLREGVLELLASFLEASAHDAALHAARRRITQEHPELLQRRFLKMGAIIGPLTDSVRTLMERTAAAGTPPPTEGQARVVLMACAAALHAAATEMSCERGVFPDAEAAPAVRARAAQLLDETMGRLT